MTTQAAARLEILELFEDAWLANGVSSSTPIVFENVKGSAPPEGRDANDRALNWVRASVRHLAGDNETLGPIGQKRFLYEGIVTVEIYTAQGDGTQVGDALAQVARSIFRGASTASGVWFFMVGATDLGVDSVWYRQDVTAKFKYEDR